MNPLARWDDFSYRRGKGRLSAGLKLGVGYRWPAASVAYGRGLEHGGRLAYCRGSGYRCASRSVPYCRGIAFGGRVGGRLLVKTFGLQ